jgi:predicted outer membrane repeat protein
MRHVCRCQAVCLLLGLLMTAPANAETASRQEMRAVGRAWLDHRVAAQGSWSGSPAPEIVGEQLIARGDDLLGLAFRIEPEGFIVVPACKDLCPVWFYGETGSIDFTTDTVEAQVLRGRLGLATEIAMGMAGPLDPRQGELASAASAENRSRWARMTGRGSEGMDKRTDPVAGVGPLLSTAWHQGAPFNLLCPIGRNGVRCAAGCAPIAAAQIARYHAYPPHGGEGEEEYLWAGDDCGSPPSEAALLHADFSDAYNWDHMPDACSPSCGGEADSAAAELCYELGVGAQADYGTSCGTGAWPEGTVMALQEHFGYAVSTETVYRASCADAHEWFGLLRDEINALRPVLYSFTYLNGAGAHSLVCDGWRVDAGIEYVSLNLGSGGVTGWYAVDDNGMSDPMQDWAILHLAPPDPIVTVGPNGEGDYPSIQAAIDAGSDGVIIELFDGVYTGSGNRDLNCLGKRITIRSRNGDPSLCVIDCQGNANDQHRAFVFNHQEDPATAIQGLTMRHGYVSSAGQTSPALGGAVLCEGAASPRITNCVFSENRADQGGAIGCSGAAVPEMATCVFWKNTAREGGAFSKTGPGDVPIRGSTFQGNSAPGGSGLYVGSQGALLLAQSIVAGNRVGGAMCLTGDGTARLSCCDLYANDGGDWTGGIADQLNQDGNISVDPGFCYAEAGDLGLDYNSPCVEPDCGLMGARPGSCGANVFFVGAAPQYAYHTIAAALADAREGGRIVLMDSLYTGAGNRDLLVPRSGLTIESSTGDPAACVLDLQGSPAERHRAFNVASVGGVTFRGLTVRHGWSSCGSAINLMNAAGTQLRNCVFQECAASGSWPDGSGGAVQVDARGRTTIADCRFDLCTATLDGGAVNVLGDGRTGCCDTTFVENCAFSSNTAGRSGGALAASTSSVANPALVKVKNSVFRANSALNGGAIMFGELSRGWVASCTLVGNGATVKGGCAYVVRSSHSFTNCIVASSTGRPPFECQVATLSVTCSDFWQNEFSTWTGCAGGIPDPQRRNIFLDPQFCAPQAGDFRLAANSPCLPGQPGNESCGSVGALPAGCPPPSASVADEPRVPTCSFRRFVPNPFSRATRIEYALGTQAAGRAIEISIHDVSGRLVRTLFRGTNDPGLHAVTWNALDDAGRRVGSGVFFCRLRTGAEEMTQRVIVLR